MSEFSTPKQQVIRQALLRPDSELPCKSMQIIAAKEIEGVTTPLLRIWYTESVETVK